MDSADNLLTGGGLSLLGSDTLDSADIEKHVTMYLSIKSIFIDSRLNSQCNIAMSVVSHLQVQLLVTNLVCFE